MELNELPGSELILPGLEDLRHGRNNTIGSLLIAIASTRLTEAGLDIPQPDLMLSEPELALYEHLENERDDAYSYYNALLDSLNSFCTALELMCDRSEPDLHPHLTATSLGNSGFLPADGSLELQNGYHLHR
jgi:hypothetical protein